MKRRFHVINTCLSPYGKVAVPAFRTLTRLYPVYTPYIPPVDPIEKWDSDLRPAMTPIRRSDWQCGSMKPPPRSGSNHE